MPHNVLSTLDEQIDPAHTALVVVDPQNDFCSNEGAVVRLMNWEISRIQAAVPNLNQFIQWARNEQFLIVWTRTIVDPDRTLPSFMARSFMQAARVKKIELVKEGLKGSDWYSGVTKPLQNEFVITKYHYDAFEDTHLDLLLRSRDVKTVLLAGFISNVCVETTARHGYTKGYYIVLVSDCMGAASEREHQSTLFNIGTYFGKVATAEEIERILD